MTEESTPPLKQLPTGTSERSLRRTASSSCPRISSSASSLPAASGAQRVSRSYHRQDSPFPPAYRIAPPGGSWRTPAKNVSPDSPEGISPLWRNLTIGSGRGSKPTAVPTSALASEANQNAASVSA